jgi:hypothetical protein
MDSSDLKPDACVAENPPEYKNPRSDNNLYNLQESTKLGLFSSDLTSLLIRSRS